MLAYPIISHLYSFLAFSPAPSDETLHTLATAYFRSGSKMKTYVLLSTCAFRTPHHMTPKNRYLLALVCFGLEKYGEAESTLLKTGPTSTITTSGSSAAGVPNSGGGVSCTTTTSAAAGSMGPPVFIDSGKSGGATATATSCSSSTTSAICDQIERVYGEIGAFALKLYGLICVHTERSPQAMEAFSRCLKLNPFLWNAYEHVCRLGSGGSHSSGPSNPTANNNVPVPTTATVTAAVSAAATATSSSSSSSNNPIVNTSRERNKENMEECGGNANNPAARESSSTNKVTRSRSSAAAGQPQNQITQQQRLFQVRR